MRLQLHAIRGLEQTRSGGGEQLSGVAGRRLVGALAAEHAADLLDHALAVEALDRGRWPARSATSFSSRKWTSAREATCGRWVMQTTWRPAPSAFSRSPTTRAVLPPIPASISSKTRVPALAAWPRPLNASITRESSPPEAASRSGAASMPGFGSDPQLDGLTAAGPVAVGMGLQHDLERGAAHRELVELGRDPLLERRGCLGPAGAELLAELLTAGFRLGERRLRLGPAHLGTLQTGDLGPAALGVRQHRLDAAAVLAFELVDRFQPLLDRQQCTRVGLQALGVVAQLRADVAELDRQGRDPLGDCVEPGVEPGRALQQRFGLGQRRRRAAAVLFGPGQPRCAPAAASRRPSAWRSRSRSVAIPACSAGSGATSSISESS